MRNWLRRWRQPTARQQQILQAMYAGWTLKSHRYLDGQKHYQLHPLQGGNSVDVDAADVERMVARGWIQSNQKFPAATFLLSELGRSWCDDQTPVRQSPLGSQKFHSV